MKYVDNYILAILLGLECGRVISYRDEDFEDVHPDRRLERDFVKILQGLVNNSLMTNDGDFPLRFNTGYETAVVDNKITAFFKEYVEAISSDAITPDWVKTITWESRVGRFLRSIDKEQLLSDYSIDESYIQHMPVILYGYVKGLIEPKNFVSVLKQIPFTYEEEDSCEPAVKPITDEDDESQYVKVSAKMDLVKLVDDLKLIKKDQSGEKVPPKPDVIGFSKKQVDFTIEVIRNWYFNEIAEYSYVKIRKKLGKDGVFKDTITDEDTLAQNNVSKLNTEFKKNFGIKIMEDGIKPNQFGITQDFIDNIEEIMFRFGIEKF